MNQSIHIASSTTSCLHVLQELEQIEETWKTDARHQRDRINHLEEENHRLNLIIRDKIVDAELQAGMTQQRLEYTAVVKYALDKCLEVVNREW